MKRNHLIMIIVVALIITGLVIMTEYYSLENQILRDVDEYYEKGQDSEIGNQIMNKIGLMAIDSEERLQSFLEKNPKVNEFLKDWAIAQG